MAQRMDASAARGGYTHYFNVFLYTVVSTSTHPAIGALSVPKNFLQHLTKGCHILREVKASPKLCHLNLHF